MIGRWWWKLMVMTGWTDALVGIYWKRHQCTWQVTFSLPFVALLIKGVR